MKKWFSILLLSVALMPVAVWAQEWRTESLSLIDRTFMQDQRDLIDDLARRNFGGQINGNLNNDIAVMQRLLDEKIVRSDQVGELQAMGLILGDLLKSQKGLNWIVYIDRYGRSRSLQVPGFNKDFIFPITQVSRKAEVGIQVRITDVYQELEQSLVNIRNKPLL